MNFCDSTKTNANVIRLWHMRKLTLEGKITIFKSLTISKIVYLALLTMIPNSVIDKLRQIQKMFLWGNKKLKIKNEKLCNKCKDGGLKNVGIVHETLNFMAPLYGWVWSAARLEPLQGGSLLFTNKFPEIPGTHFINLRRMKGWVGFGATQWLWTWDHWIGNPVP